MGLRLFFAQAVSLPTSIPQPVVVLYLSFRLPCDRRCFHWQSLMTTAFYNPEYSGTIKVCVEFLFYIRPKSHWKDHGWQVPLIFIRKTCKKSRWFGNKAWPPLTPRSPSFPGWHMVMIIAKVDRSISQDTKRHGFTPYPSTSDTNFTSDNG